MFLIDMLFKLYDTVPRLFVIPFTMNRACTITHDRPNAHTEESRPRSFAVPIFFFFFSLSLSPSNATVLLERAAFLLLCLRSDGRGASKGFCQSHERKGAPSG